MPVGYIVVNGGKLVVERWVGAISHDEIVAHERSQTQDAAIIKGAKVLADLRSAELGEATSDLICEISAIYDDPGCRVNISACAVVFGGQGFDEAKLWEVQARQCGVNIIVFNNLEIACIWLGIDRLLVQELLDSLEL